MRLNRRIQLKEMDHAYWLTTATFYANYQNGEQQRLFDDAASRAHHIRDELEELYRAEGMGGSERVLHAIRLLEDAMDKTGPAGEK